MQNSLRNGEAQIRMRLPQTLPCARTHPRRFEEQYKTAGMTPLNSKTKPLLSIYRDLIKANIRNILKCHIVLGIEVLFNQVV